MSSNIYTVAKREHLHQDFRLDCTNKEIIPNMWLHIRKSPLQNWYSMILTCKKTVFYSIQWNIIQTQLKSIHYIVTHYKFRCLKKVIYRIDRKWKVAPFSKFYGKVQVGFCLKHRKALFLRSFIINPTERA